MKRLTYLAALLSIAFGCAQQKEAQDMPSEKPNILFLLSDDHSVPYLGCYEHPDVKTPNIDMLASEGIRYNRAYTTAPQCVPSRAAIMTGRHTVGINMTRFTAPLPRNITAFPELLRDAGYYTGICGRSYHLDGSSKKAQITRDIYEKHNLTTFPDRVDFLKKCKDSLVFPVVKEFLDSVPKGKPFFMWAGYNDPHRKFTATDYEPDPASLAIPEDMPDTELLRKDMAGHIGEVQRLDYHVGLILEELKKRGLYDNTLIIFMGDNGAALLRGKGTLYEKGLNVPLVMRYPDKIKAGIVSEGLVSGEDIAPTSLDIAGLEIPPVMSGRSLLPSFNGQTYKGHPYVVGERGPHASSLPGKTSGFDLGRSIVKDRYKLIYNCLYQLPYWPIDFGGQPFWKEMASMNADGALDQPFDRIYFQNPRPIFELYDLQEDPSEYNNLIDQPELVEVQYNLKADLQEWMMLNQDFLPLPLTPYKDERPKK